MTLGELYDAVGAAMREATALGPAVDMRDIHVLTRVKVPSVTYGETPTTAALEEFPDDEETYRQHVRAGGKREFSFMLTYG